MCLKDIYALRFLWRANPQDDINNYVMLIHIFDKVDSPCCTKWALQKASPKDQQFVKHAIQRKFYLSNFLKSLSHVHELIVLSKRVISIFLSHRGCLTKWVSNSS